MNEIRTAIASLIDKPKELGIILHPPATDNELTLLQTALQRDLPSDIKYFYTSCNGIDTLDSLFRILSISAILEHGDEITKTQSFPFAEYMIFSDVWTISLTDNGYTISNADHGQDATVILTTSISEFLDRYCRGGLFGKDGLYDWYQERKGIIQNGGA